MGRSLGFWHALYTLDEGNYGVWEIAKYMVNIWSVFSVASRESADLPNRFGLDATGFELSSALWISSFLGPI